MFAILREGWAAEPRRRFLWYPTAFAVGIAVYFALPTEPNAWLVAGLTLLSLASIALLRRYSALRPFLWMWLLVMIGIAWSSYITFRQHQIVIAQAMPPQMVKGTIRHIERTSDGFRLTLNHLTMSNLAPEETPEQIRISMRPKKNETMMELPPIGTPVEVMAGLLPPMGPALPGGFDFGRYFYFNGIGAVGFGLPPLHVLEKPPAENIWQQWRDDFWTWRSKLTDRLLREGSPQTGPIIAGFITGDIRALPESNFNILRASNLYHIVAISGEHMMLISGVVFLLLRWVTLWFPARLRYRPQMKTIAAVMTLIIVTLYVFVTGLPPSAIRAYLMIALVLLAVILRRQANPMRSLFFAATLMLIASPANLFDPGFQLSFSATIALIALIEYRTRNFMRLEYTRAQRILNHLGTMLLASFVAELATTPFVLSQFNTIAIFGIVANTLATPLVSFFLMPLVALFFLLLPFGLSSVAVWLMDKGIQLLMAIANEVGSWPHGLQAFPSPPEWAVALFAFGLIWFCIWQTRWRYAAVPLMVIAFISPLFVCPPDVLIGAELKQIAFRSEHGYVLARGRATSLLPKIWANGVGEIAYQPLEKEDPIWRCDTLGCIATVQARDGTHRIAFAQNAVALSDDCLLADMIVTSNNGVPCTNKPVIDGDALKNGGIHAVWFQNGHVTIRNAAGWQHHRPWSAVGGE